MLIASEKWFLYDKVQYQPISLLRNLENLDSSSLNWLIKFNNISAQEIFTYKNSNNPEIFSK